MTPSELASLYCKGIIFSFFVRLVFVNCLITAGTTNAKLGMIDDHTWTVVLIGRWHHDVITFHVSGKNVNAHKYLRFNFSKITGSTNIKQDTINYHFGVSVKEFDNVVIGDNFIENRFFLNGCNFGLK